MKILAFIVLLLNTVFAFGECSAPSPLERAGVRLFLFSNPTTKDLTSEYMKTDESINAFIEIYNLMGSLVFTKELSDAKTTIDLNVLSSGSYLYSIKYGNNTLKQNKLVIVK